MGWWIRFCSSFGPCFWLRVLSDCIMILGRLSLFGTLLSKMLSFSIWLNNRIIQRISGFVELFRRNAFSKKWTNSQCRIYSPTQFGFCKYLSNKVLRINVRCCSLRGVEANSPNSYEKWPLLPAPFWGRASYSVTYSGIMLLDFWKLVEWVRSSFLPIRRVKSLALPAVLCSWDVTHAS